MFEGCQDLNAHFMIVQRRKPPEASNINTLVHEGDEPLDLQQGEWDAMENQIN